MKIVKLSYTDPNEIEVTRWLEHIIELSIIEELECSDQTKIQLKTSKYFNVIDSL